MHIKYRTKAIQKICTDFTAAKKKYGEKNALKIFQRIQEISSVDTVEQMIRFGLGRCHHLLGDRKSQYAVDLVNPFRLVFSIEQDDGQTALIIEVIDYH